MSPIVCFITIYFLIVLAVYPSVVFARPLEGLKLRCCTLEEPPFVFRDRGSPFGYGGIAMEYLRLLQDRLGFSCSNFSQYTEPSANSVLFTSFIHRLEKCSRGGMTLDDPACQCDIGAAGWNINKDRIHRVDFVQPFVFDPYRALTHIDNLNSTAGDAFFLTTFSVSVWASIVALVVIFTFLKMLDRRFAPADDSFIPLSWKYSRFERMKHYLLKSRILYRLRRAMQSVATKMIGQSAGDIVGDYSSTRQWILNFAIVLCGLFLVLTYEATMTASLVREDSSSPFRTINDLKNCHIPPEDVCIPKGGAAEAYWRTAIATNPCHAERGQKQPTLVGSHGEAVALAASKKCKFVISLGGTLMQPADTRYCGILTTTGAPFFGGSLSFVLRRGSNLTKHFDRATLLMRNEDIVPTVEGYLNRDGRCSTRKSAMLTFRKLKLFFYFAFSACFLIFLEMVFDPQQALKGRSSDELEEGSESPATKDTDFDGCSTDNSDQLQGHECR